MNSSQGHRIEPDRFRAGNKSVIKAFVPLMATSAHRSAPPPRRGMAAVRSQRPGVSSWRCHLPGGCGGPGLSAAPLECAPGCPVPAWTICSPAGRGR